MKKTVLIASEFAKIFWLAAQKLPEGAQSRYHIYSIYHYSNDLDLNKLVHSLQTTVNTNYNLRSNFVYKEDQLRQIIYDHLDLNFVLYQANTKEETNLIIEKSIYQPFNLNTDQLFRFVVIENKHDLTYTLLLNFHHIILDGSQIDKLCKQIEDNYHNPKPLDISDKQEIGKLKEYLQWERQQIEKTDVKRVLSKLENYPIIIDFPYKTTVINKSILKTITNSYILNSNLYKKLKEFSQETSCSIFNILKTAWSVLIAKYSNQNKVVISYSYNTRGKEFQDIKGCFVNTLIHTEDLGLNVNEALKNEKDRRKTVVDYLSRFTPIGLVLNKIGDNSILTASISCLGSTFYIPNLTKKCFKSDGIKAIGDAELFLLYFESNDELSYQIIVLNGLFESQLIQRIPCHLETILVKMIDKDEKRIKDIDILSPQEYQQIVYEWNRTKAFYPKNKTIHQLFEEQVEKTPDNVAVMFENKKLTYKELNAKSNQLARYLRRKYFKQTKKNLKPDTLIALCLDRNHEIIIAILAILKAGGAYVPIDPNYPNERINYIIDDTNTKFVIIQSHIERPLKDAIERGKQIQIIVINSYETEQELNKLPANNLNLTIHSTDLIYVIYTSGTTGKPKGITVEHGSVINLLSDFNRKIPLTENDKCSMWTNICFDVSVYEIFTPLIIGATLFVISQEACLNDESYFKELERHNISSAYIPPFYLKQFLDYLRNGKDCMSLRRLLVGVEPIEQSLLYNIHNHVKGLEIINGYGPTEATICSELYLISTKSEITENFITPIGKPVANTHTYILDSNLTPVPVGVIGELHIGGVGLARGYLNQPELTAKRFINNPFAMKAKGYTRLYKTGDLVRWLPDGNIEYIGRNDFQIKIRGFRVELGEIESAIAKIEGIKQVTVQAKEKTGTKYLVAYYVNESKGHITQEAILDHLNKILPDYMIPSGFVELESLPLTVNGKLDISSLPAPEFSSKESYIAPSTELEQKLCNIWQEVLEIERVGVMDNFFRIGGNSILALQVTHRMSKVLNKHVPIAHVFQHKTIINILSNLLDVEIINIPQSKEMYPKLSFAQERLWFIDQYEEGTNAYNIPIILQLSRDVNIEALNQSLNAIIHGHQVLRTVFKQNEQREECYQNILEANLKTEQVSYTTQENLNQQLVKDSNYVFKLNQEIPFKVWLYNGETKDSYLLINIHHVAFDGWSIDILLNELSNYYDHYTKHTKVSLPKLSLQYKDFAEWQRDYLTGEILKTQIDYWKEQLSEFETLALPTDKPRPSQIDYSGKDFNFEIEVEQSNILRKSAQQQRVTLYTVLLTIFNVLLYKYTNQTDIVIGTPVANRHYSQLEHLIGFFVNSLVIRTKFEPKQGLEGLIQQVHSNLVNAQAHQDLPFERLVEELKVEKDTSRHPIFQVMFTVQNFGSLRSKKQQKPLYSLYSVQQQYSPAKFDLSLFVDDAQDKLHCTLNYAARLFNEDTVERLAKHYRYLIQQITEYYQNKKLDRCTIENLQVLTNEEYEKLVYGYNKTEKEYTKDKTINQLFEEQVVRSPNNGAVVFEDKELTYEKLNAKANQLARYIREQYKKQTKKELKPDTLITLCLDRSLEMIIAILAVLKTGGAYVPIDPGYPEERINYILEDTKTKVLITQEHLQKKLKNTKESKRLIVIDNRETRYELNKLDKDNLRPTSKAIDLAYVIYTSGTTGNPKGVMVEHKSVTNLADNQMSVYGFKEGDQKRCLQFAPFIFDASVWELFYSLFYGHKLFIVSDETRKDPQKLEKYLVKNKIQIATLPPALLKNFDFDDEKLEILIVAGETPEEKILNKHYNIGVKKVINAYGPTEATVCASLNIYQKNGPNNIGKNLFNTKLYILSSDLTPVPIGAIGELYIGGAGLARGYLNQPELTKECFIENPFATEADKTKEYLRLYKTGDLVRWLPDGNIDYIGRNDFQVKIRGYRIELGEIENKLLEHPSINQAIVIARMLPLARQSSESKCLIAYYKIKKEMRKCANTEILREYLSKLLPGYMVPTYFVELETIPLNTSGKVDMKKLPVPEINSIISDNYIAPTDDIAKILAEIWCNVLKLEKVGINNNFFDVGGDSLKTVKIQHDVNKRLKIDIKVIDIFKHPTIRTMAEFISGKIKQKEPKKEYPILKSINREEIAIIGYSGAFSGCSNIEEYWDNIVNGRDCISHPSREKCLKLGLSVNVLDNKNYVASGGLLNDIDKFDAEFWGISPRDAELMDPQIRHFLQHSYMALENSGYLNSREDLSIGVFAGAGNNAYFTNNIMSNNNENLFDVSLFGNKDFLATIVAYYLNLSGPALTINTACSTSLVTVAEASNQLILGQCDLALAGGVTFQLPQDFGYIYHENTISSPDGHCRVFDKKAKGTVGGSGVSVVVLKRLSKAKHDNDPILAVIKGYAINNDGNRKVGYTAPSIHGQKECILKAQKLAGISSDEISYIECHGTATELGDVIEIQALNEAFRENSENTRRDKCILGGVKANIGHTDSASGIAGLIKTCKMLQKKIIPPQIYFEDANPHLHLEETPFKVVSEKQFWTTENGITRKAGVSAFGIGGTNAHVILEEAPDLENKQLEKSPYSLLSLSAKTESSLKIARNKLADYLLTYPKAILSDIAYTLHLARMELDYRYTVVCRNITDAVVALQDINRINTLTEKSVPKIVFMCSGAGEHYINMGRGLYDAEPFYREQVNICCELIQSFYNVDLLQIFYPQVKRFEDEIEENFFDIKKIFNANDIATETENLFIQPAFMHAAVFITGYATAKLLMSWKIIPSFLIGHSIGEYLAACLSGVLLLKDALYLVVKRAQIIQSLPKGAMLAIPMKEEEIIPQLGSGLSLSAVNGPSLCVVSGEESAIKRFEEELLLRGVVSRRLPVTHAFHSTMIEQAKEQLFELFSTVTFNAPQIPYISNLTGKEISYQEIIDPTYWVRHTCQTVRFSDGVKYLLNNPDMLFLEVGPGSNLVNAVLQHQTKKINLKNLVLNTLHNKTMQCNDYGFLLNVLGKLWLWGVKIDWRVFYKDKGYHRKEIPGYSFEKNRYWIEVNKNYMRDQVKKLITSENNSVTEEASISTQNLYSRPKISTSYIEPKSKHEKKLAAIWQEILGIENIGVNDCFFDLGGNSLTAAHLVSKIGKEFNKQYSTAWSYNYKTIHEQASDLKEDEYHNIICFNNKGKYHRLFFVHPGDLGAEAYYPLAKELDNNISFFGIDSHNIYSNGECIYTIEELSEKYLREMQKIQPHGPYFLGGWSLGGTIAYEMAKRLHEKHEQVLNVFMIDAGYVTDQDRKRFYADYNFDFNNFLKKFPAYHGLPKKHLEKVRTAVEIESQMILNYNHPPVYEGNTTLFIATQHKASFKRMNQDFLNMSDDSLNKERVENWRKVSKHLRVVNFDATHMGIMEGKHLKRMAKIITDNIFLCSENSEIGERD